MDGRRRFILVPLTIAALAVAGCAADQLSMAAPNSPGFWLGFWHGLIAPVTFVISLFTQHVRVYAFPNAGRWYDFGFMLGIQGFSGGIFAGSRRTSRS